MTECVKKKSFLCPFLSPTFCLFSVCCFDITFFVHSGFLGIKEKEGTFLYTRTRAQKKKNVFSESFFKEREREREREREKKSMGKKEVIRRFVSFRCNRKGSVKKTFALREMMLLSARFFLTYSFRGAPVF